MKFKKIEFKTLYDLFRGTIQYAILAYIIQVIYLMAALVTNRNAGTDIMLCLLGMEMGMLFGVYIREKTEGNFLFRDF